MSQDELHDSTIMNPRCVFLMVSIVCVFFFSFLFHQEDEKKQRQERKKRVWGETGASLQLRGLLSLFVPLYSLIFKSHRLGLTDPPLFLLAGQALYYGDKSMHVCAVCERKKTGTVSPTLSQGCGGSHLPKLVLIAPPTSFRKQSGTLWLPLCLSITPFIADVIRH